MAASLTYVFCLVRSARRPRTDRVDVDLPGARNLRALAAGKTEWLIVATVPASHYDEQALAQGLQDLDWVGPRAMAHEAIVEAFLKAPAVLPMQLFSLFTSDERALEHVDRERRRIERILSRIDGQHEWGLRLTWDEKAAREMVEARATARPVSGAAYLTRKSQLLAVNRAELETARRAANRIFKAVSALATDALRRTSLERAAPGSRLLLDAAFLVPARGASRFRAAVRRVVKEAAGNGVTISLTGPWPPYNFV